MIGSDDLESTYADLSRTEYSWEELKVRPLPPGVDPAKIETYLSNDVFLVCIAHFGRCLVFGSHNILFPGEI